MGWVTEADGGRLTTGRTLIKEGVATLFERTGALRLLSRTQRALLGTRVHILGFHRVVDDLARIGDSVIPSLCISTGAFERLLDLAVSRFEVLPLDAAVSVLAGRRRAARDVLAITFDDAYRDVYLRALPALARRGLPATVFVPTGHIGRPEALLHDRLYALLTRAGARGRQLLASRATAAHGDRISDENGRDPGVQGWLRRARVRLEYEGPAQTVGRLIEALPHATLARLAEHLEQRFGATAPVDEGGLVMTAAELRACVDGGLELGAHTVDHVALIHESRERVRLELERPRADLAAISGRPCRSFAYCNGLFTPELVSSLRRCGYTVAVTTRDTPNRPGADPLLLGRRMFGEGHTRGVRGDFSTALVTAHLSDLFGSLAGTTAARAARAVRFGQSEAARSPSRRGQAA